MLSARNVVKRIQQHRLNSNFSRWDTYCDDRAKRRESGAQTPPTDGEDVDDSAGMIKKVNTKVQRSAAPGVTPAPETQEALDNEQAVHEMGMTMRLQQEEIARLTAEVEESSMRAAAKEYQWKEVLCVCVCICAPCV